MHCAVGCRIASQDLQVTKVFLCNRRAIPALVWSLGKSAPRRRYALEAALRALHFPV